MQALSTAVSKPFPKLLQTAGYQTSIIGKWHLITEPQGFDYWCILNGQHEQGDYYNPDFIENGKHVVEQGYVTDIVTDKAIEYLEHPGQKQTFLYDVPSKSSSSELDAGSPSFGNVQ